MTAETVSKLLLEDVLEFSTQIGYHDISVLSPTHDLSPVSAVVGWTLELNGRNWGINDAIITIRSLRIEIEREDPVTEKQIPEEIVWPSPPKPALDPDDNDPKEIAMRYTDGPWIDWNISTEVSASWGQQLAPNDIAVSFYDNTINITF